MILAQFTDMEGFPAPVGVLYVEERGCYEADMVKQIEEAKEKFGEGDLEKLLFSGNTWEVS